MTVIQAGNGFQERQVEALYSEALLLSDEMRAYFAGEGRSEREALPALHRVQFACEALKATTRMLQLIAWLAACRRPDAPPEALPTAPASGPEVLGHLPSATRRLILAGIDLHERAGRVADGPNGPVALGSPARALLYRLERAL